MNNGVPGYPAGWRPTIFGSSGTAAKGAATQLTLKPLRDCVLERCIATVGAGDPATVSTSDLSYACAVTECTINGVNFVGTSIPCQVLASNSTVRQPWQGVPVNPSTNVTITISNKMATLVTDAVVQAAFQGVGPVS